MTTLLKRKSVGGVTVDMTEVGVLTATKGMDYDELVAYLKTYKGRELIVLSNTLGIPCSDKVSKTEALQKCLSFINLYHLNTLMQSRNS